MFGKSKDFAKITAPLSKMVDDLNTYADEQTQLVSDLNEQKRTIDRQIGVAEDEKSKSLVTAKNLGSFMDPSKVVVTEEVEPEPEKAE